MFTFQNKKCFPLMEQMFHLGETTVPLGGNTFSDSINETGPGKVYSQIKECCRR